MEPEACQLIPKEKATFSEVVVALHVAFHFREDEISRFKKLTKVMAEILGNITGYSDEQESVGDKNWKPKTDAWRLVSQ